MAYLVGSESGVLLNGYAYDNVPVMLNRWNRPIGICDRYIRYLMRLRNLRPSSVIEKAKDLVHYVSYLEKLNLEDVLSQSKSAHLMYRRATRDTCILLAATTDEVLEVYRNACEGGGTTPKVINRKLGVIFRFFVWAQSDGSFSGIIGERTDDFSYPINIWWEIRKNSGKKVICSDLLFRGKKLSTPFGAVPTNADMEEAYIAASQASFGVASRDVLLLKLTEDLALRGAECLALKRKDLPTRAQLANSDVQENGWLVTLTRKGGYIQDIAFPADILSELLDYVEDVRAEVMSNNPATDEHGFVFVAHDTGQRLNRQYISRRLSKAFAVAKQMRPGKKRKLTHQRVRAKSLTELFKTLIDEEVEKQGGLYRIREEHVLAIAAGFAGHSNPESLRNYLEREISSRLQRAHLRRPRRPRSVD
ncbi:tyrosine recombinase XerC [Burkholderia pseudomallei]|nr:tyrosine recombinase XerC [Burkholderia pseudomallei]CAJ9991094.1 tyrosine recombinase XerC [Burkholderia pseudomallei]